MLYEIMRHLHNFFRVDERHGVYDIKDGMVSLPFLKDGQYFLVEGSVFNDGVYEYPYKEFKDEEFEGYITALAPPSAFLDLVTEIEEWQSKNGETQTGPYTSESFGGYSYTKATDSNGNSVGWEDAFRKRLNVWRKR